MIIFGNKVNNILPRYALKVGLKIYLNYVKTQKIDDSTLKTFEIVLASF